jgi:alpha-beta hydrolase superfamily lysophospholipase
VEALAKDGFDPQYGARPLRRAIQSLKDAGVQNIECKLYPGARHELLVETNKQEVFADIGNWLDKQLQH